jgi:DNA-binding winged helix-turn-helix (wHTH) protein
MLFVLLMNLRKIYFYGSLCLALLTILLLLVPDTKNERFPERVKIALREVGNKLLLYNQDSTSLVLPVQKIEVSTYHLSFEKALTIDPDTLVLLLERSFQKAELPSHYQIEVKQCEDAAVAYSFLQFTNTAKSIIPCSGRVLPQKCYTIEVRFLEKTTTSTSKIIWMVLLFVSFIGALVFYPKRKKVKEPESIDETSISLGKFAFYPEENKLRVKATEISLSKKEVELLLVFVSNPNKIIKREELSKKVWEDHGVFVGRSLDTYISKLRKKLSEDASIQITNVHGVGYILEVKES